MNYDLDFQANYYNLHDKSTTNHYSDTLSNVWHLDTLQYDVVAKPKLIQTKQDAVVSILALHLNPKVEQWITQLTRHYY